jgi:hypothetical protein
MARRKFASNADADRHDLEFWCRVPPHDVTADDVSRPGVVFPMGVAPGRIDILTELTGVSFAEA